jgi:RNA polymerase sigma-70 factor (ECF subfamily)
MGVDLEEVVRELAPRLLRYLMARFGNRLLAEEVAQESLTALVRRWRNAGPPGSPEAFAFAIARRRAGRTLLRQRIWLPIEGLICRHSGEPDPEACLLEQDGAARTLAALSLLPAREREALALVAFGELNVDDAARMLSLTPSAFKMRVHRARQRLKSALEEEDVT